MCTRLPIALVAAALVAICSSCQKAPAREPATSPSDSNTVKIQFFVTVPNGTDPNSSICIAGNLTPVGSWRANGLALHKLDGDGTYAGTVELPRGRTLEYKITQGSWETVEKGPAGEETGNRTVVLDSDKIERIAVASWSNENPRVKASTITGDVRSEEIHSKILDNDRRLWIYLPPGYDQNKSKRYPVLYMHDGQNLFDDATSFAGEWQADETAERLIAAGTIPPIIIVGIDNNAAREDEYTPTRFEEAGGNGHDYARFVVEEVKPFIDRTYRTRPQREFTGVAGSSLGGLISLYIAMNYPETFGLCGAVSPSLWWDHQKLLHEIEHNTAWARQSQIWIDIGTAEHADRVRSSLHVMNCRLLASALTRAGLVPNRDFVFREYPGAGHNEQSWAARFGEMLEFLYAGE